MDESNGKTERTDGEREDESVGANVWMQKQLRRACTVLKPYRSVPRCGMQAILYGRVLGGRLVASGA